MHPSLETLLIVGVGTAMVFVAVLLIEGALRRGYGPTYYTGSELSLGDRGWIQIANFLQFGVGMFAFAVGVSRTLTAPVGAVLLAIFGLGMIAAGVFLPDLIRGYPRSANRDPGPGELAPPGPRRGRQPGRLSRNFRHA